MNSFDFRIASHSFTDPSGEINMERVAPGAGIGTALTNFISGETSIGVYPGSLIDCKGYGRIVFRTLFEMSALGVSMLPLAYDENGDLIGPLTSSSTETEINVSPTLIEHEGKKAGPVVSVSNEDVGAAYFKLQLLSTSGEVHMDYSLV